MARFEDDRQVGRTFAVDSVSRKAPAFSYHQVDRKIAISTLFKTLLRLMHRRHPAG
jgi:hypothetical protein